GTAEATLDYEGVAEVVRFDSTTGTSQTVNVPIIDDKKQEPAEDFLFLLGEPSGATLGSPDQTQVTIQDNDTSSGSEAQVQFQTAMTYVMEGLSAVLTITRTGNMDSDLTVSYATVGGSATPNLDFVPISSGQVTIPANVASTTVSVSTLDDTETEPTEFFQV